MRSTCCRAVCVHPARKRVLVGVRQPRARTKPEVSTPLARKYSSSASPAESSPSAETGSTRAPRSARLLAAFAPPPGTNCVSRCRKISTGASRETREISPNTNSSATKSPRTRISWRENDSTKSTSRARSAGGPAFMPAPRARSPRHATSLRPPGPAGAAIPHGGAHIPLGHNRSAPARPGRPPREPWPRPHSGRPRQTSAQDPRACSRAARSSSPGSGLRQSQPSASMCVQ